MFYAKENNSRIKTIKNRSCRPIFQTKTKLRIKKKVKSKPEDPFLQTKIL